MDPGTHIHRSKYGPVKTGGSCDIVAARADAAFAVPAHRIRAADRERLVRGQIAKDHSACGHPSISLSEHEDTAKQNRSPKGDMAMVRFPEGKATSARGTVKKGSMTQTTHQHRPRLKQLKSSKIQNPFS